MLWHHAFVIALANIAILLITDAGRFVLRQPSVRSFLRFPREQPALALDTPSVA